MFRLCRYKSQVSSLLKTNKTTSSRFLRLFVMSSIVIVFLLPSCFYELGFLLLSKIPPMHAYSWSFVHSNWDIIRKYPSLGLPVHWDRWMWISSGYIVFLCFGIGREARAMYRDCLLAMRLGRIISGLEKMGQSSTSESKDALACHGRVSSKARPLINRKRLSKKGSMTDSP
jgi:pheromone a factor receptor